MGCSLMLSDLKLSVLVGGSRARWSHVFHVGGKMSCLQVGHCTMYSYDERQDIIASILLDKLDKVPLDMLKGQREPFFFRLYILRAGLVRFRRLGNHTCCEKMQITKSSLSKIYCVPCFILGMQFHLLVTLSSYRLSLPWEEKA